MELEKTVQILFLILSVLYLVLGLFLDLHAATVAPDRNVIAMMGVLGIPSLFLAIGLRKGWSTSTYVVISAVLLTFHCFEWHPRKGFAAQIQLVSPGMEVPEVDRLLLPYSTARVVYSSMDQTRKKDWSGTISFRRRNIEGSHYDSDVARISFERGVVKSAEFERD